MFVETRSPTGRQEARHELLRLQVVIARAVSPDGESQFRQNGRTDETTCAGRWCSDPAACHWSAGVCINVFA